MTTKVEITPKLIKKTALNLEVDMKRFSEVTFSKAVLALHDDERRMILRKDGDKDKYQLRQYENINNFQILG